MKSTALASPGVVAKCEVNKPVHSNTAVKANIKTAKTVSQYFSPSSTSFKPSSHCRVANVKVKFIRPAFQNLREWCDAPGHVYIGRAGVVFVPSEADSTRKERYPKRNSIWANPFKVGKQAAAWWLLSSSHGSPHSLAPFSLIVITPIAPTLTFVTIIIISVIN